MPFRHTSASLLVTSSLFSSSWTFACLSTHPGFTSGDVTYTLKGLKETKIRWSKTWEIRAKNEAAESEESARERERERERERNRLRSRAAREDERGGGTRLREAFD